MRWLRALRFFLRRWFDRDNPHGGRSYSDQLLVKRLGAGLVSVGLASGGILLIGDTNWREVIAGALLAWGVALMVWAVESYRHRTEDVRKEIRHTAELDVIHARLNQIAAKVGARPLGLQAEIEHVTTFRVNRLAHFAGLDEFTKNPHGPDPGVRFWDEEAQGGEI